MPVVRNVAVTTFMEQIPFYGRAISSCCLSMTMLYWGDRHPVAYVVAFGPLFRTLYLFARLIRYKRTGSAIRYAVPTVIIFWNFVEILRRASFILFRGSRTERQKARGERLLELKNSYLAPRKID